MYDAPFASILIKQESEKGITNGTFHVKTLSFV
jgi:hypothetical protein